METKTPADVANAFLKDFILQVDDKYEDNATKVDIMCMIGQGILVMAIQHVEKVHRLGCIEFLKADLEIHFKKMLELLEQENR